MFGGACARGEGEGKTKERELVRFHTRSAIT